MVDFETLGVSRRVQNPEKCIEHPGIEKKKIGNFLKKEHERFLLLINTFQSFFWLKFCRKIKQIPILLH